MLTARLLAADPRLRLLFFIILIAVARCDNFSTYPSS